MFFSHFLLLSVGYFASLLFSLDKMENPPLFPSTVGQRYATSYYREGYSRVGADLTGEGSGKFRPQEQQQLPTRSINFVFM